MEVPFCSGAIADPPHGDPAVALDRRAHRPAHGLRKLGPEIAGDREEAMLLVRVHDRQLPALQLVARVRVDLAHHLRQRIAARDEQPLLAVRREVHVVALESGRGRRRDRFLAGALHVETGLSLTLGAVHPIIEDAHCDHVAQDLAQAVGIKLGVPWTNRLVIIVKHANERRRQCMSSSKECSCRVAARVRQEEFSATKSQVCRRAEMAAPGRAAQAWARCGVAMGLCQP